MLLTGVFGWAVLLLGREAINAVWALDVLVLIVSVYFLNRNPEILAHRKLMIAVTIFFLTGLAGIARILLGL
jgi:hypothetical protein